MRSPTARLWAVFGMALWFMGTVAIVIVATQNFYTVDRLLADQPNPAFSTAINKLADGEAREVLRYLSSELNRLYFQYWNIAQLAIGLFVLWMVIKVPGSRLVRWYVVAMLGIVLFLTVFITPQMLYIGRELDFVARVPPPPRLRTFGLLHAAYSLLDGILIILGILTTVWLFRGQRQEVNAPGESV